MQEIWIKNPYPLNDTTHYRHHLPNANRPVYVPALLLSSTSAQTIWSPKLIVQIDPNEPKLFRSTTDRTNVIDLVNLIDTNAPSLLDTIYQRFCQDEIYTFAGLILIAMNPYKALCNESNGQSIYGSETMTQYRQVNTPTRPHVFSIVNQALENLTSDQSILISGESGAGKSETTKIILQYIANLTQEAIPEPKPLSWKVKRRRSLILGTADVPFAITTGIERQILQTNPIMEAFGNAKTCRNDNSSRFGKLIHVFLDQTTREIRGGKIVSYLLEKSRVVNQTATERNYHVFYQMIYGMSSEEKSLFQVKDHVKEYVYLNPDTPLADRDDVSDYQILRQAMKDVAIDSETQSIIFSTLSAILLLGNLKFNCRQDHEGLWTSEQECQVLEQLLGLPSGVLHKQLTQRELVINEKERSYLHHTVETAKIARDALAKELYRQLFDSLIARMNETFAPEIEKNRICILDIFGFEVFEQNSFEQLCINYANEKLHQYFISFVIKAELELYKKEGIDCSPVKYSDNYSILDLIEAKPVGILSLLDESCLFPNATDDSFLQKINKAHVKNTCYQVTSGKYRFCFIIKHSAMDVRYSVTQMVDKNKDKLSPNLRDVMRLSKYEMICNFFPITKQLHGMLAGSSVFLGRKFRADIETLLSTLSETTPHFIKCIKPNDQKRSDLFDQERISNQFHCLGILDAIKVRKNGFPYQVSFQDFIQRYQMLGRYPFDSISTGTSKDTANDLILQLWKRPAFKDFAIQFNAQLGQTRVFLRHQVIQIVENERQDVLQQMKKMSCRIQKCWRQYSVNIRKKRWKIAIVRAQALIKAVVFARRYARTRRAIILLQSRYRMLIASRSYRVFRNGMCRLEAQFRRHQCKRKLDRMLEGFTKLSAHWKGYRCRRQIRSRQSIIPRLQRNLCHLFRNHRLRQQQVRLAILMQKYCRGALDRAAHAQDLARLESQCEYWKFHFATRAIQSQFRRYLAQCRYIQLQVATDFIMNWWNARSDRFKYLLMKDCAIQIQALARGFIYRCRIEADTLEYMMEELQTELRLKMTQEAQRLTIFNESLRAEMQQKQIKAWQSHVIDLNYTHNLSDVYPSTWATALNYLQRHLRENATCLSKLSLGGTHSVAISTTGHVYTWGWSDFGQLGHANLLNQVKPRMIHLGHFRPLRSSVVIVDIATGQDHTLALSECGRIYTWGDNRSGQLGHGDYELVKNPQQVETIRRRVVAIGAGAFHSVALVDGGSVYSWGKVEQRGRGQPDDEMIRNHPIPRLVPVKRGDMYTKIHCGWQYTAALTCRGKLFTWGVSYHGELGHGKAQDTVYMPREVLLPDHVAGKITDIACGGKHILVLLKNGAIYSWGSNSSGQLGHGDTLDRSKPCLLKYLHGCKVKSIAAGIKSSSAVVQEKSLCVLTWGERGIRVNMRSCDAMRMDNTFESSCIPERVLTFDLEYRGLAQINTSWSNSMSCTTIRVSNFKNDLPMQSDESAITSCKIIDPSRIRIEKAFLTIDCGKSNGSFMMDFFSSDRLARLSPVKSCVKSFKISNLKRSNVQS